MAGVANEYRVVAVGANRLAEVGPLFKGMVEHHRTLTADQLPVRTDDEAWRRRRREYEAWLSGGRAWLLLAVPVAAPHQAAVGYALVRLTGPGPTWDLGEEVGELESLAVAGPARGHGTGSMLLDAARELLRARGVGFWSVAVVEGNAAARLYERSGFRPFIRELIGPV